MSFDPDIETRSDAIAVEAPSVRQVTATDTTPTFDVGYDDRVGRRLRRTIEETSLPAAVERIFDGLDVGGRRPFVWQWIYYVCGDVLTLPEVPADRRDAVQETRFFAAAFTTLVDDIAERDGDGRAFWELARATMPGQSPDERVLSEASDAVRAAERALTGFLERFEAAPNGPALRAPVSFDLRASLVAMDHARVAAESPGLYNRADGWAYETTAIGALPFFHVDLAYGPSIDAAEYRRFRELVTECERLWRIGNWVTTWRRELAEGDFSAAIFREAIRHGVVEYAELLAADGDDERRAIADRIAASGIPAGFARDFRERRDRLREAEHGLSTYDPAGPIDAMEALVRTHLAIEDYRRD
ncbi:hypothetical protein [Halococcoides cellulosivorans]|uniref:Uncharacterized protein n=1 Tax=Halococcoides cellulosivorans TaxID=1679096 RepID=A0A2R4X048_9EURY|nr:hypothetical protein [Halococcoides cellulosivorans]AWB27153.1 hypothetical protein HARCEL1_05255 [Halococcoides cellulosivorans]